jgi:hypothetical protein
VSSFLPIAPRTLFHHLASTAAQMRVNVFAFTALAISLFDGVNAGMFPAKSSVKMLDSKTYQRALAEGVRNGVLTDSSDMLLNTLASI